MTSRTASLLITATLVLTLPVLAGAQIAPPPAAGATPALQLKVNQEVWVTTLDGWDAKVTVNQITAKDIEVSGELGTTRIDLLKIRRIARKDSNLNGFLIGAGTGAVGVLASKASASDYCDRCKEFRATDVLTVALQGGIGMLVDNAIDGRRTVYVNNSPAPLPTQSLATRAPVVPQTSPTTIAPGINAAPEPAASSVVLPVKIGRLVWVTTEMGWEIKGVVSKLTDRVIEVSGASGTKAIALADVRRIDVKDSNKNGFAMGATFAVLPALLVAGFAAEAGESSAGSFLATWAVGTLAYGSIGILIDSAIVGRQTIWVNGGKITMQLAPVATRRGLGIGGTFRW